ncbi:MAG TPA: hypothetical protein ENJ79_05225 [Gammaproteobacteria bacterium]|nr:hypothetical protein [Gammaproteobacteria bacterium]HHJ13767.1 hypothetical protein [Gammaproteobacteria bacterium]
MCCGFLPVAVEPLWQLAQLPLTLAWLKVAPPQPLVVWQSSQVLLEAMWLAGLPVAMLPL